MKTTQHTDTLELFFQVYMFIKKYFILILAMLVLGTSLGVYKNKTFSDLYEKDVLIYSDNISYLVLKQFSISLAKDIQSANTDKVAAELFIDVKTAKKIITVQTDSVSLKGKIFALTSFTLTDTTGTATVSKGYIKYLSSSPYIHEKLETERQKCRKILDKLDQKLQQLQILQEKGANSTNVIEGNSYKEYIDLYSKKLDYEYELNKASQIELVREYNSSIGPRFGLLLSIIIYGAFFLTIAVVIGWVIELWQKLRKLEQIRK